MDRDELLDMASRLRPDEQSDLSLKHVVDANGHIYIEGNKDGLLMLAEQIVRLVARNYVNGIHQDFDPFAPSDEGSVRMTIQRREV